MTNSDVPENNLTDVGGQNSKSRPKARPRSLKEPGDNSRQTFKCMCCITTFPPIEILKKNAHAQIHFEVKVYIIERHCCYAYGDQYCMLYTYF